MQVIERKKEKSEGEEGLQGHRVLLLLHAGPTDVINGDGDGSTSGFNSPMVPCHDIICWSWRPILSRRMTWRTDVPVNGRTGSRQHSDHAPITTGDVNPREWPDMAIGHVEKCSLPSRCQKFDPRVIPLDP